jgi:hypothetical protein
MRTANRAPKRNYLAATVQSLWNGGVKSDQIHLFPTDPDVSWMPDLPGVHVYAPAFKRSANENGLAPIALLDTIQADWIVLSEDDLAWCDDPLDTMARWLQDHARSDIRVYRFFAFDRLTKIGPHSCTVPLREQKGSQVIALRADHARRLAAWAAAHPLDWRPREAPFQHQPATGFDKLVGYWALQDRPSVTTGLVSWPFFVRHLGIESSLHRIGITRHEAFAARPYEVASCV